MARSLLFVAVFSPVLCYGQVTGTFSMDKSSFAVGEPAVLSLTLHNVGSETEEIVQADPYSFCSGYRVHITPPGVPDAACFESYGGSCLSGALSLAPGASHTERILLNYRNTSRGFMGPAIEVPGDYLVDATREIRFAPLKSSRVYSAPDHSEAHEIFSVRVDEAREVSPATYAPYVQQLESKDNTVRMKAARTLATLAPPSLEPLLLTFPSSKDSVLREFAPLALANLGTKASLAALGQMLLHSKAGTYEFGSAAGYLGKTHDAAWLPLLLEVADQYRGMYLANAAESGGEAAVPALLAHLQSADSQMRSAAIYALGHTGSRAAVPILIGLLKVSDSSRESDRENAAIEADVALTQLTHVYAEQGRSGSDMVSRQSRWRNWWLASGPTARIYKPGECAADTKLP